MKVLVAGADGYIGFPLCMHLARLGFNVAAADNFLRRKWVAEVGSHSAIPIESMPERIRAFEQSFGKSIHFEYGDVRDCDFVRYVLEEYKPDTVVHLAQQASAPYSMTDVDHAIFTQTNNLVGTLNIIHAMHKVVPRSHLVKLGSMGEYGACNIDIPEGFFEIEYRGRKDTLLFPKRAFSDWYHWSKTFDSGNMMLATEIWGLACTDIMQGIVYGTRTDEMLNEHLLTRFDFDAVFGTILNRFCAQAVLGHALTVYGSGNQKRPVISLRDSIQCIVLAIQNPAVAGEYRVFNQFHETYSAIDLAQEVKQVASRMGFHSEIQHIENPRTENEQVPYYNPIHEKLYQLGFKARHTLREELEVILNDLTKYKSRLVAKQDRILPSVSWTH
jgi:nucleoside-diphosphate-sugar epimerase